MTVDMVNDPRTRRCPPEGGNRGAPGYAGRAEGGTQPLAGDLSLPATHTNQRVVAPQAPPARLRRHSRCQTPPRQLDVFPGSQRLELPAPRTTAKSVRAGAVEIEQLLEVCDQAGPDVDVRRGAQAANHQRTARSTAATTSALEHDSE